MARVKCPKCGSEFDVLNHDGCFIPGFHDETDKVIGVLNPAKVGNENNLCSVKEKNMNKIEALKAAGFTDEQINQMMNITGVSLNGEAVVTDKQKDEIEEEIFKNGYVKNTRLHRRWITSQFIKAYFGNENGVRTYINKLDYMYQFKMMLEEIRVISILENEDDISFNERSSFFTKQVVLSTCEQYIKDLENFIDEKNKKEHKTCKGIPYVHLNGLRFYDFPKGNVFMADVDKKIISPLKSDLHYINRAHNYKELYHSLRIFMRTSTFIALPYTTKKSPYWCDAYLGAGAYYSLKNLVTYSGLRLRDYEGDNGIFVEVEDNIKYLKGLVSNAGYKLYALFKQAMIDNNFTLDTFKKICETTKNKSN